MHLLVDSTGLKLGGPGEWLTEKHGTSKRRSWRKLHLGVDADTGQIAAVELTGNETMTARRSGRCSIRSRVRSPRSPATAPMTGRTCIAAVAERHPDAAVVVPPRRDAVPSTAAETDPTQRDRHLQLIAERGRMGWQKATGYNARAKAEAAISRYKRVIGDALRSRTDDRQATEVAIAVRALNRMLELGRPKSVRIA